MWWIFPWFPSKYLILYDRNGNEYEFFDNEIEYLSKTENITIMKCRSESISLTIAVLGEDPFSNSLIYSPNELFGKYTMMWNMYFGFLIYTIFLVSTLLNVFNVYVLMILSTLITYFISVSKFRFETPSIQFVVLHEYGSIDGYPLYIYSPYPQSTLTFHQILKMINIIGETEIKDKILSDLLKETEVSNELVKRLYSVITRIERQSEKIYDSTYRLANVMLHDVLHEIHEKTERTIGRIRKFWILVGIVLFIFGLVLGFTMGSSITITVGEENVTASNITSIITH